MDIVSTIHNNLYLYLGIVAVLGLSIGSFLNVVIYRLPKILHNQWNQDCHEFLEITYTPPKKISLMWPLSHCPQCKSLIRPWHNIPILSYLLLGGKCAHCHKTISPRYMFVELLTCVASVFIAWHFGFSWQAGAALLFTWMIIALTFIDFDTQLLPDNLTQLLVWLGLFFSLFHLFCSPNDAIIGALLGYLIFYILAGLFTLCTGKVGMGNGDFKFLAALGAFLGWQMLPFIIICSCIIGIIGALGFMVIKNKFKSVPLPFGPSLAIAGWIALVWGPDILQIYLTHLLG